MYFVVNGIRIIHLLANLVHHQTNDKQDILDRLNGYYQNSVYSSRRILTESPESKSTNDKKVLLRERKRHTARRVVSTPSVVLTGYPPRGGT